MAHNLLTDRLPAELTVCGRRYPVFTDFRRWILVTELFAEDGIPAGTKLGCAAKLIFRKPVSVDANDPAEWYCSLADGILWFVSCGKRVFTGGDGSPARSGQAEAVFDFTQDSERILAAFRQTYGIDLGDPAVTMHFWKFMALLRNLPRETEFMRTVSLRMTDTAKIENDDLRRQIRRAKASVRIRGNRDMEGKERYYG
ncbi:MAG: hypothetical protein J6I42_10510 [Clostridia bacterium]|nr:hypothetical protein [Clostridia bacterium]MBO5127729.1 hypothetical protein [Clostridia bacterium]